jgi:hypothetical protein
MEREALRARTTELLEALRMDPSIPQAVFEILEIFAQRLDRIEIGHFGAEETPTKPEPRRASSGAIKKPLGDIVRDIFEEEKKK